jgi:cytochrome c oxidase assembly protein subunit 15
MPRPSSRTRITVTPSRYRTVVVVAGFLLAGIIMTGAAVRLTGSGLGCENWPTCSDNRIVPAAGFHPWIEFGNRLLSGAVAAGVGAAVLSAYRRAPRRPDLIRWAWGLVAGVFAQILLGGATVLVDLHPLFVSGHFLLSIVLLWNAMILLDKARRPDVIGPTGVATSPTPVPRVDHGTVVLGRAAVGWSIVVLLIGTLVTGTGPHSGDPAVPRLGFDLGAIVRVHSAAAWICVALCVGLVIRLRRAGRPDLDRLATATLAALMIQGAIGYVQYFTGVPALLVELHVLGSIVVFCTLLWTHLSLFSTGSTGSPDPVVNLDRDLPVGAG